MKRYALSIIFFLLTASAAFAQTKTPVEGVWKIAERIVPGTHPLAKGVTITNTNPPSLIIFTRGYYSQVYLGSAESRAVERAKDPQNLTDAEKIARYEAWRPLFANAGTYEIKGSALILHPIVAKNPNQMSGRWPGVEFKLEGPNTLWLIPTAESAMEPRIKLTRVE